MGNVARVRVELKHAYHNQSQEQQDRAFKSMFAAFKRKVNEAGIMADFKDRQYYESPGEKRRRKKKEQISQSGKETKLRKKWKEHFGN